MRVLKHTEQQFVAEEKPLIWFCLFALFALASAILVMQVLGGLAGWQTLAAGFFFAVSGHQLFSIERVWLILDREENIAELRCGRIHEVLSVDALTMAGVLSGPDGHSLAIRTALCDTPITLASSATDTRRLELCAAALNAWLLRESAATLVPVPAAPRLDSELLLT